jgi:hypothetical protein
VVLEAEGGAEKLAFRAASTTKAVRVLDRSADRSQKSASRGTSLRSLAGIESAWKWSRARSQKDTPGPVAGLDNRRDTGLCPMGSGGAR